MRILVLASFLILCPLACLPAYAAEPFTPAQLKEIERMLSEQRELIRKDILDELKSAQSGTGTAATIAEIDPIDLPDESIVADSQNITPPVVAGDIEVVPLDRGMRGGLSGLELETGGDSGEARATLARTYVRYPGDHSSELGWSITATSPLDDKENKRANFATLDGLSNGFSLKLALTHATTRKVVIGGDKPSEEWSNLCKMAGEKVGRCLLSKIHAASQAPGADALRAAYERFAKANYGWGRVLEGRIGGSQKKYDFLAPDMSKDDDTKHAWSVGGSVGFTTPNRQALYAFGFDFQRTYKEVDARVYCPAPTLPTTVCVQGRLGEPAQKYNRLLWLETRSSVFSFPFALRVTQELESDITGVDLPIYLFRGEGKPFAGGIRLGWTSEQGADGGIFVSSAFDVFK